MVINEAKLKKENYLQLVSSSNSSNTNIRKLN